jgi:hypothetical protein
MRNWRKRFNWDVGLATAAFVVVVELVRSAHLASWLELVIAGIGGALAFMAAYIVAATLRDRRRKL